MTRGPHFCANTELSWTVVLRVVCILCGAVAAAQATPKLPESLVQSETQRIAAISNASRSTIAVFAAEKSAGGGSGVIISTDGYALTNFHVVQPCGIHMICGLNDGRLYDAVVVGIDPTGDLALIKLMGRDDFTAAEIADSDDVKVGDACFAIGNPFLLATDLNPTVTYGVVSGVRRYQPPAAGAILEYTDCIQTDAAINPGNSGGPLFNADGRLIGINGRGSFEKRGRVSVGVGYAISINQAKNFLGVLHSGRIVDHATLGATATTDEGQHVVVTNILESSDAYRRGLRYGDELLSLAGRRIDSANTLKNVLGILPKGWRVPLEYQRDDQVFKTYVRLAGSHSAEALRRFTDEQAEPNDEPPGAPQDTEKNEEPPADEESPERSPKKPPRPSDRKSKARPSRQKVPKIIADSYEARNGYANYHFNRRERDRVCQKLSGNTQTLANRGRWSLTGQLDQQGAFHVSIEDDQVFAKLSTAEQNQELVIDVSDDVASQLSPQGSGGLYVALYVWRRLLTRPPDQFGEVYYWGTAPLPDRDEQLDVLVGIHDVVESRFYFSKTSGQLISLEMFPDANVDPCELFFEDYRPVDGQLLPHTIHIHFGDRNFGTLTLDDIRIESVDHEDPS